MSQKRKKRVNSKISSLIVFLVIALIAVIPGVINHNISPESIKKDAFKIGVFDQKKTWKYPLSVHFIDVGQGGCTLITSSFGNILYDCGEYENVENVKYYLYNLNIEKIDYLIASHPHTDHIGGMATIVNNFDVGKFYMPELDDEDIPTSSAYEKLLQALDRKNVESSYMKAGDSFMLGDINCLALAPVKIIKGNVNCMSIILKVNYKDFSLLLTGDAEVKEETTVLDTDADLKSDILSIAHHGSKSSSSYEFLKAVNPDYAVISCGIDNKYNHPHKETIDKLNNLGIKYYRTDELSDIIFSTDGDKIYDFQSDEE